MTSSVGKRARVNTGEEKAPPKRRRKDRKDNTDWFSTMPVGIDLKIMRLIQNNFPLKNLLNLGHTCVKFRRLADNLWEEIRKEKSYVIDFPCCQGSQASNYFLAQNIESVFLQLGLCTNIFNKETLKLFQPVRKCIIPVNNLFNLFLMKRGEEISPEIISQMKDEPIFEAIASLYKHANSFDILKTSGDSGRSYKIKLLKEEFKKDAGPKATILFDKGASYISTIASAIFHRFYLICPKGSGDDDSMRFTLDLCLKAKKKGNDIPWIQLQFRYHKVDRRVHAIWGLLRTGPLYDHFLDLNRQFMQIMPSSQKTNTFLYSDWGYYWKTKWLTKTGVFSSFRDFLEPPHQESLDKLIISWDFLKNKYPDRIESDPRLLCAIFKVLMSKQKWIEADQLLDKVVTIAYPHLGTTILWAAARLKAELLQFDKADEYYNQLIGLNKLDESMFLGNTWNKKEWASNWLTIDGVQAVFMQSIETSEEVDHNMMLWNVVKNNMDKITFDPKLICAMFTFLLQKKAWAEADKLTSILVNDIKFDARSRSILFWLLAKLKVQVKQFDQALSYLQKMENIGLPGEEDVVFDIFHIKLLCKDYQGALPYSEEVENSSDHEVEKSNSSQEIQSVVAPESEQSGDLNFEPLPMDLFDVPQFELSSYQEYEPIEELIESWLAKSDIKQ